MSALAYSHHCSNHAHHKHGTLDGESLQDRLIQCDLLCRMLGSVGPVLSQKLVCLLRGSLLYQSPVGVTETCEGVWVLTFSVYIGGDVEGGASDVQAWGHLPDGDQWMHRVAG